MAPTRAPWRRRRARVRLLGALLAALLAGVAPAAEPPARVDPLFADDAPLELEIEGPIERVVRDRSATPVEHPAQLRWRTAAGETGMLPIELRARGNSRRRPELCEFPPLRLDIPRSEAAGSLFDAQDKLKLVTHCLRLGSRDATQREDVALEFLAYRILNLLTDRAFRVRAAQVTYVTEDARRFVHPGFLIESRNRLGHRLGLATSEARVVPEDAMDPDQRTLMDVFQYMIGNTDYSFRAAPDDDRCCHNAEQLVDSDGTHWPVPYDFDLSGLLDKPDATPARGLGIDRVTDRVYLGACPAPEALERILDRFRAQRGAIDTLLADADLRPRRRRLTERFLDRFWDTLADPDRVRRAFLRNCD